MRRFAMISALMVCAALMCSVSSPRAVADTGSADARTGTLQRLLDRLVRESEIPGAQLVITERGRDIRLSSGVGNLATGEPFPSTAQVRIASVTKSFVAATALLLVAENKVELDAPVQRYLPGVVHGPGGDGNVITVRNLLQHTSGIPDYLEKLDISTEAALRNPRPVEELLRLGLDQPARFAPGTDYGYSNTNYLLAGELIERVTGRSLREEVTDRVIEPLALADTYWPDFPREQVIRGPHPHGYAILEGKRVDLDDFDPSWGLADGAMVATPADLNRYFTSLLSARVLPPTQLTEMQRTFPTPDPNSPRAPGLGLFHLPNSCNLETWGHDGAFPGYGAVSIATTDRAATLIVNQLPEKLVTEGDVPLASVLLDTAICGKS
ncbi:beta-lactamase family protein [Nocardia sp. CDC159]|uniref:Beta-lactamase family protein n=1 Tax=Nocardia pulmonis TaxID=2951408 RepID=A0A9X2IYZ5_9NOCA|nr:MULTISPECIES: serine hydrolase domain-containing protein [Nocardia]MCM6777547.1 beta-lactamase family protein [Nocardia pulmonis]MCM6790346.1 beta-lactamase family protein [Nocardia sp. CDC159]